MAATNKLSGHMQPTFAATRRLTVSSDISSTKQFTHPYLRSFGGVWIAGIKPNSLAAIVATNSMLSRGDLHIATSLMRAHRSSKSQHPFKISLTEFSPDKRQTRR
jgi:hypothetical protein